MPFNTQGKTRPDWGYADTSQYTGWDGKTASDYGDMWSNPAAIDRYGNHGGSGQGPDPWSWTTDYDTGVFNHPGYDEDWFQDHSADYDQPSSAEQYWAGVNGKFAAGPERSTGAAQGYDQWADSLLGPGFTAAGAGTQHGSNFGEQAARKRDTGPSRSEVYADAGGPTFSNYGADAYGSGANRTTFDAGAVFSRFFDPLSQESNSEKLYGTDPGLGNYYDRAYETGSEKLSNAMAAKGLFQSGAAADEERNLIADLGADRAKNEADYRLRAAGQSDSERRGRMGLAGQLGSAADSSSVARSQNERQWAGMLDDTELGHEQERRAGREFADTSAANRDTRNMNWADMLDSNTLARSAEDRGWATAADADRVNRSGEARNWSSLLNDETKSNNQTNLDYLKAGGDLAAGADQGKYGRLADQRTGAVTAQNSMTKRYTDQFNNLMDVAKAKAGLISGAVDSATKQKIDTVISALKARLAAATNGANQTQADADEIEGMLATLTTLLDTFK